MSNKTETFLERVTAGLATDPELRLDGISPFLDPRNGRRRAGARRSQAAGMRLSAAKRRSAHGGSQDVCTTRMAGVLLLLHQ